MNLTLSFIKKSDAPGFMTLGDLLPTLAADTQYNYTIVRNQTKRIRIVSYDPDGSYDGSYNITINLGQAKFFANYTVLKEKIDE